MTVCIAERREVEVILKCVCEDPKPVGWFVWQENWRENKSLQTNE
jgi:hypothetical protein